MGINETTPDPIRPADVARDDVRVQANRCPFCHTDVDTEADDHLACKACLARHHASCWEEAGACSACGSTAALVSTAELATLLQAAVPPQQASQNRGVAIALAVALSVMLAVLGFFLGADPSSVTLDTPPPPIEVVDAPRGEAALAPPVVVESMPAQVPEGTIELKVGQRRAVGVEFVPDLVLAVGDVHTMRRTTFTLSDAANAQTFHLRVGEEQTLTLGEFRYRVLFRGQFKHVVHNDTATVWITPLD